MQPRRYSRENRAAFPFGFAAHRNHEFENLARFPNIEHGLRLLLRDIDPNFPHYFDDERIDRAGFEPGALRFKVIAANGVEPRFRHLAPRAVMNANEEDFLLFHIAGDLAPICETPSWARNNSSGSR